jgi:hypothetical protein
MAPDELFIQLFEGRIDVWGALHGECMYGDVTVENYERHLHQPNSSLGIYPLIQDRYGLGEVWADRLGGPVGDNFVKWGCTDIDDKADPEACWPLALNLQKALGALGITAWIERTKGKGYHVWVFADEWVPAIVMRRALLVAHQLAGVAPTEVNPKQVDAGARVRYGNYVNLPYPHGWQETRKRAVVGDNLNVGLLSLDIFVEAAWQERTDFDTLHAAAKLYVEPPKQAVVVDRPVELDDAIKSKLSGLAWTIFKDGPLAGRDRSGTLQRLAFLCAEGGLQPGEALAVVKDADARWGKFSQRPDCDEQLGAIVTYAYGKVT